MKELISAISQATANRLRSPILGSFVLSWLVVNSNAVLTFIFSDSTGKLNLLKAGGSFWTLQPTFTESPLMMNIIWPLLAALVYTFVVPFAQHLVDYYKFDLIDKKRIRAKHKSDAVTFRSQKVTSRAKALANPEYWTDKLNRDLDKWDKQRERYEADLDSLREERDSVVQQSKSFQTLSETHEKVIADFQAEKDRLVESLKEQDYRLKELTKEKERVSNQSKNESRDLYSEINELKTTLINKAEELEDAVNKRHHFEKQSKLYQAKANELSNSLKEEEARSASYSSALKKTVAKAYEKNAISQGIDIDEESWVRANEALDLMIEQIGGYKNSSDMVDSAIDLNSSVDDKEYWKKINSLLDTMLEQTGEQRDELDKLQ